MDSNFKMVAVNPSVGNVRDVRLQYYDDDGTSVTNSYQTLAQFKWDTDANKSTVVCSGSFDLRYEVEYLMEQYHVNEIYLENYFLVQSDDTIIVKYSIGVCTLTLPLISTLTNNKKVYKIIDGTGNASTYNIIVNASGSDTIIGNASTTINTNYNSVTLLANGTTWFLV
jgi:hypothetical protein